MARSMLSLGMLTARALSITSRSRGLPAGSPPPMRAAVAISRINFVKTFPRLASMAPFLRRILAHFEWPDMPGGVSTRARFRPTRRPGNRFSFARFGPQGPARSADRGRAREGAGPPEEAMADSVAIGIDLGTSNSCVALARGRKVDVLPNAYGENITASVVHFQEDASI